MPRDRWRRGAVLAAQGTLLAAGIALAASRASASAADGTDGASAADAAPAASPAPAADTAFDPEAEDAVRRMVRALEGATLLEVRADEEYDALQQEGGMLSFGRSVRMTLRRPDRLRFEAVDRSGAQRSATWDGLRITACDAGRNVFASVERTGNLDAVLDFLRDDVGAKLPLAPLFSDQLRRLLLENLTEVRRVGAETLGDSQVLHVALRYAEGVGLQLWIPSSDPALPRRLVMIFEQAGGRPQLRADFREWSLAPGATDAVFAFQPPEGARAVPFVLPKRTPAPGAGPGPGWDPPIVSRGGPAAGGLGSLQRARNAASRPDASPRSIQRWEDVARDAIRVREPGDFDWTRDGWLTLAAGTAISSAAFDAMRAQPTCGFSQTEKGDTTYYHCGSTWYVEAMTGNEVGYVAVEPPLP
jgi:hypothetical protein